MAISFKTKMIASTSLALSLLSTYARRSYADCDPGGTPNSYICSGTVYFPLQYNNYTNAAISTISPGLNADMQDPHRTVIEISGDGAISFTDDYNSTITTGSGTGILIRSYGDYGSTLGSVTVNTTAHITANIGISALNQGNGDLYIRNDNYISAADNGIIAESNGSSGNLTVINNGLITVSGSGDGIHANMLGSGANHVSSSGKIYAQTGIDARNYNGTGISVVVDGKIYSSDTGILLHNYSQYATTSSITTGASSIISDSAGNGIYANIYAGSLSISIGGSVIGAGSHGNGIDAVNQSGASDLVITTDAGSYIGVTGRGSGIVATNNGAGITNIDIGGTVNGYNNALTVENSAAGSDIIIRTQAGSAITSDNNRGIFARNYGTGDTHVMIDGSVAGARESINVLNYVDASDLFITTYAGSYINVTDRGSGIVATNQGSGIVNINIGGTVKGDDFGLKVLNEGTDLIIGTQAGSVVIGENEAGIYARNYATGDTQISIGGTVTGFMHGLDVISGPYTSDLIIVMDAGSVIEPTKGNGILAINYGMGELNVSIGGDVRSDSSALDARNSGADLVIETLAGSNLVSVSSHGIYARNYGTGSMEASIGGDISSYSAGVDMHNFGSNLTFETKGGSHIVSSNSDAINAVNHGNGILSASIGGNVSAVQKAVHLFNRGGDLMIETLAGSVITTTGDAGIFARNEGSAAINAVIGGEVHGYSYGAYLFNYINATDIYVGTTADSFITSDRYGIRALNAGTGFVSAKIGGEIESVSTGLHLTNYGGGDLTAETQSGSSIDSDSIGIYTTNRGGTGALMVTVGGDVTGFNKGVWLQNRAGTDAKVETLAGSHITSTNDTGLYVYNKGTGVLDAVIGGEVQAYSTGVYLFNYTGTDLNLTTLGSSAVTSANSYALNARNTGSGEMNVYIGGDASGSYGLNLHNYGTNLNLEIAAGANLTSTAANIYGHAALVSNEGSGELEAVIAGTLDSAGSGILFRNSGSNLNVRMLAGSSVTGTIGYGVELNHNGSGNLSFVHHGEITGDIGLTIRNAGGASTGIVTDGVIEGTSGTAILFTAYNNGPSYSTTATPIEIAGGRIIGSIIDNYASQGFSLVRVTGDFTSEGNFKVFDFGVAYGAEFTLGEDNVIETPYSTLDIYGTFTASNTGGAMISDVAVNGGGVLNIEEDLSISGYFANYGTTRIATGKELSIGTMGAATGDLYFGFNTSADHALLTVTGGAADITNQHIVIDVTGATGLANGEQALLIDGAAPLIGGPGGTATTVDDLSVLWDFRIVDGTGAPAGGGTANQLYLIAQQSVDPGTLATTQNNANAAAVLMTLQSTTDPELAGIVGNMNGAATAGELNEILEAVQPVADASEQSVLTGFMHQVADQVGDRMDGLRRLNPASVAARFGLKEDETPDELAPGLQFWRTSFGEGDEDRYGLGSAVPHKWIGGSGSYVNQDRRGGIDGYDAVSGGAAFGIDTGTTFPDRIFGFAFGYNHAEAESNNANRAETSIDSLQLLAYASRDLKDGYYADLAGVVAQSGNETTRHDVGGTPGLTADGDFSSRSYGIRTGFGREMLKDDYLITPRLDASWLHYTADGYTETGAGGANLTVDTKSLDSLEIGGSLKIAKEIKRADGVLFIPEADMGYHYDLIGDPLQKTVAFTGGGSAFAVESPDPARHRFSLGAGVAVKGIGDWDYSLAYKIDMRQDSQAHNINAKASWRF